MEIIIGGTYTIEGTQYEVLNINRRCNDVKLRSVGSAYAAHWPLSRFTEMVAANAAATIAAAATFAYANIEVA